MPTTYRILIGCGLITAVALISDRSRTMAGILGTAPINIPIILWIIWSKSTSDYTDIELGLSGLGDSSVWPDAGAAARRARVGTYLISAAALDTPGSPETMAAGCRRR